MFIYESDIKYFQQKILKWYLEYGRDFPWRKENASNYELIISEIFLQRTRAVTVAGFLPIFLNKYPTWEELMNATEKQIQKFIKPLGLYRQRGSKIYKLVQELKQRNLNLPTERNQLEELPMFGQYITNAFELYIMKKRSPLLDINMARLLERFFGKRKRTNIQHDPYLQTLAYRVVDVKKSKELNWGILDFASLVCKKRNQDCYNCVIIRKCKYYKLKLLS